METNHRIIELKHAIIRETSATSITLPTTYWLNSINADVINKIELEVADGHEEHCVFNLGEETAQTLIRNKKDFDDLLEKNRLNSDFYEKFRIFLKPTKKWGMKPLFIDTPNTINFICMVKVVNTDTYLLLYNFDGTRSIEAINIHGIWKF